MKKICVCLALLIISIQLFAETVVSMDGYICYEIPEECNYTDIHHRNPRKLELSQWSSTVEKEDNFHMYGKPLYELLIKDKFILNALHVRELLLKNNYHETDEFVITPNYRQEYQGGPKQYIGYLPKSYQPIIREDIIGEEYMYFPINAEIKNKYRATTVNYSITLVLEDRLERISFGISSIENSADDLIQLFPDWFTMHQNNLYYWKNQNCLDAMYDLLFSDDYKKLPRDLQLIRETRDMILQTVRVNDPPVDTSNMQEGVITH